MVLDLKAQDYRAATRRSRAGSGRDPQDQGSRPRNSPSCAQSSHPQAQFLWAMFRDLFHYSAYHLADIADTARDVDLAIRWGYGWSLGPFETWQAAGWKQVAQWIADDIAAGKAMSDAPLPAWVIDGREGVHAAEGSYSPARNAQAAALLACPSTSASCSPIRCSARNSPPATPSSRTMACACGTDGDGIAIVAFKTKMNTVNDAGARRPAAKPSATPNSDFKGLVIWQTKRAVLRRRRSVRRDGPAAGRRRRRVRGDGRQLPGDQPAHQVFAGAGRRRGARHGVRRRLRVPDAQRAHGRGAGKLHRPGRGGRRPAARRRRPEGDRGARVASCRARRRCVRRAQDAYFETVAMAKVSTSALEAQELGLLRDDRHGRLQRLRAAVRGQAAGAAPWPKAATARRCPRAASRSPAMSASRRSR